MKISRSFDSVTVPLALALTLLGGCASMAVTSDALERNTVFALGMDNSVVAPPVAPVAGTCNALLKAAGRC